MEDEQSDNRSSISSKEVELEEALNQLRKLEEKHLESQMDRSKLQNEIEIKNRENEDLSKANAQLSADLQKLNSRIKVQDETIKEQGNMINKLKSEVIHFCLLKMLII